MFSHIYWEQYHSAISEYSLGFVFFKSSRIGRGCGCVELLLMREEWETINEHPAFVPGLSRTSWRSDQSPPAAAAVCLSVCQLLKCRIFSKFSLLCWSSTTPTQHPPSPADRTPPLPPLWLCRPAAAGPGSIFRKILDKCHSSKYTYRSSSSINITAAKRGSCIDDSDTELDCVTQPLLQKKKKKHSLGELELQENNKDGGIVPGEYQDDSGEERTAL